MTDTPAPRRITARRLVAISAVALGASGTMALAQDSGQTAQVTASIEGGEAGETGFVVDPGADLGLFLANIDVMEARTNLLQQLINDGNFDGAASLSGLMKQAYVDDLQQQVGPHGEDFTEAFADLDKALAAKNTADAADAIDWLRMEFEEAREGNTPAPHAAFTEIGSLVRAVTNIMAAGDMDTLTLAQARAVLDVAIARNQGFLTAEDALQAKVAGEIAAQLALLGAALAPSNGDTPDLSLFYGAAARVEISAQKVQ